MKGRIGRHGFSGRRSPADSLQFSSLNTRFAPRNYVGSALTIVNCIWFLITIISIELLDLWISTLGIRTTFLLLALGPMCGWLFLKSLREDEDPRAMDKQAGAAAISCLLHNGRGCDGLDKGRSR